MIPHDYGPPQQVIELWGQFGAPFDCHRLRAPSGAPFVRDGTVDPLEPGADPAIRVTHLGMGYGAIFCGLEVS